jgi:hypothetical protein
MSHNERVQDEGTKETHPEKGKKKIIICNRTNEYSSISDKGNI